MDQREEGTAALGVTDPDCLVVQCVISRHDLIEFERLPFDHVKHRVNQMKANLGEALVERLLNAGPTTVRLERSQQYDLRQQAEVLQFRAYLRRVEQMRMVEMVYDHPIPHFSPPPPVSPPTFWQRAWKWLGYYARGEHIKVEG